MTIFHLISPKKMHVIIFGPKAWLQCNPIFDKLSTINYIQLLCFGMTNDAGNGK